MNLSNFQAIEDSDVIISFDSQSKSPHSLTASNALASATKPNGEIASLCVFR